MRIVASFRLWLAVTIVVLGLSFVATSQQSPVDQRTAYLESIIRCPACEGLSVAESNATSAVAVRHEIRQAVVAGSSDSVIITSLEARFGSSILLSPPTRGLGTILWLVPLAIVGLGVIILLRVARHNEK
ncbi:MAG: cytochrome c-type biogenesis protein CcmH [Actinomycetota bacterium]